SLRSSELRTSSAVGSSSRPAASRCEEFRLTGEFEHRTHFLLPADPLPSLLGPLQGMEDAVRIVGDLVEGGALGTDVAPARYVVVVGAEPRDAAVLDGRHEPAVHLADATVGDRLLGHGPLPQNSSTAR